MENQSHSFVAGIFVILLGIIGVLGAVWLMGPRDPIRLPVDLVTTHSVAGLKLGALVRYRGVDVGRVESIAFDKHELGRIRVRINVDPSTPLTHSTYARLSIQGINGVAIIQLDDEQKGDHQMLAIARDRVPQLELQAGLLEVAEHDAQDVLAKAGMVATRLQILLSDQNTQRVMELVDSLQQASARYGLLAHELMPAAKALPDVIQGATLALSQAKSAADKVSQLSADVDRRITVLDKVAVAATAVGLAADDLHQALLPRASTLLEQLSMDSRELESTLHQINARPQSLIFGLEPLPPGPGERGFSRNGEHAP